MSIATFIRDTVLRPRLLQAGCMVVYDPDHRYYDLCLGLGDDRTRVIDASESSIESRHEAIMALLEVGKTNREIDALVVYVPQRRTETDEEKQADPFSIYAQSGAVFPQDDGDDYLSLCMRAKPDHATEIRRIFAGSPNGPSFSVIDAIGGGASWPQLRAALRVESGREILTALMSPSAKQEDALKTQEGWSDEAREFLLATMGMSVKTRGKTWTSIADELWRFVLFSEFVFDLPVPLPESLNGVPHAPVEAKPIVEDVCDRLRTNPLTRDIYIERAEIIEVELGLPEQCRDIDDLGDRDTFSFEERTFLKAAIKGILTNNTDNTRTIMSRHRNSVWMRKGESQEHWELIRTGLALIESCEDNERQLSEHSRTQADLLDYYLGSLRESDRLQREFEQAVADFLDTHGIMHEVIDQARSRYRRLAEKAQTIFVKHIESMGWPPQDRLANADVFDRILADRLKENGRRVAYIMVDALRYELGVTLEKQLSEDGPVELRAAFAQLPTITPVGMASLLPGACTELSLEINDGVLVPKLGGINVANVSQRMDVLRKRFGDRFQEMLLRDFSSGKPNISPTVDLLVLRSTEIDSQLESNPETTLGLIPRTLKLIRVALHKLRGMGFKEAVIVTDHGFFLNGHAAAGDVCVKPQGQWPINAHDRALLGNGNTDPHSLVIRADKVGILGNFDQIAIPRSMAPYRAGHLYFHGGASLAEAVVPVIIARLDNEEHLSAAKMSVELTYRNGATRITTRVPVVEITLVSDDMFSQDESIEVLIEAQDSKGNVVGEPRAGGDVNPATRTITLTPGQRKQIALRMDPDFEGKFSIKALNPTTLVSMSALNLKTDYTV
ncbi:MAG TPA: PglZ domain-containing protein [Thalassospira lucentensis]|uniref:PglZ domain-containing protein n=1 Tax=Thalassospira lucentensis TaxID=168935 RepID=A0A3D5NEP2_9PROT|nr:PglZ domain-containing protein [Thalassospira lucentensis]HCW69911.1 PglZ domain-containing protein [Thalassospira lucentensis]|tara:strand:- start:11043 stop:13571 length:2529 start_codon:yes stop_codon:yes gene_type:complete